MTRRTISTKEPRTGTRAKMGLNEFTTAPLLKPNWKELPVGERVVDDGPKPMTVVDFAKAFPYAIPKPEDDPLFDLRTYNARCSYCGTETIPLEPQHALGWRVCLKCVVAALSDPGYDPNEYEELERDYEDLQGEKESMEEDVRDLERTIRELEEEKDALDDQLKDQRELNASMSETVDELQGKIESWDDDTTELRNKIARLELDVERWRSLAMRKG